MPEYSLTISSTQGGSVTSPGEPGPYIYDEGEVVNLVAETEEGYEFVNWTGDVDEIADVEDDTTTITMNDDYSITANFQEKDPVIFADPNLEARIREITNIFVRPIYPSDLKGFTSFSAIGRNISNLTGLEHCTSLIRLFLQQNQISDISPLANLTDLMGLMLYENQVSDISPLANLTGMMHLDLAINQINSISPLSKLINLTGLDLGLNEIRDISPLANLTNLTGFGLSGHSLDDILSFVDLTKLTWLELVGSQISDISPLANLTSLTALNLGQNEISDISPLASLTSLKALNLGQNEISDISALVQNEGLGTGDYIDLCENPLSSDSVNIHIPELEARGVTVYYQD